jgi:SPOR domain
METDQPTIDLTPPPDHYEPCEQCGSPLDHGQRYCVMCGNHRRHVRDPAARYLAGSRSKTRPGAAPAAGTPRQRSSNLAVTLAIALIPLAIGLGVLVGRASNNGDSKLIAALRAQQPEVITTAGGGSGSAATATPASTTVASTFPLQNGYAVELQTLPPGGTTWGTVTSAEAAAKSKGATGVGLILQSDYKVTPAPPAGAYVIYAGAFETRAEATKSLSKLHKQFPKAIVIQVQPASTGEGKVLTKTQYGTAHQVTGFHTTASSLAQGERIVQKVQKEIGKNYVQSQRGLPDEISVP